MDAITNYFPSSNIKKLQDDHTQITTTISKLGNQVDDLSEIVTTESDGIQSEVSVVQQCVSEEVKKINELQKELSTGLLDMHRFNVRFDNHVALISTRLSSIETGLLDLNINKRSEQHSQRETHLRVSETFTPNQNTVGSFMNTEQSTPTHDAEAEHQAKELQMFKEKKRNSAIHDSLMHCARTRIMEQEDS